MSYAIERTGLMVICFLSSFHLEMELAWAMQHKRREYGCSVIQISSRLLAGFVYHLWMERNARIFRRQAKTSNAILLCYCG